MVSSLSEVSACLDHTNLYKSCVKTLRMRSKTQGTNLPASRIFPNSSKASTSNNDSQAKDKQTIASSAQYFQKAREIQDNINKYSQLLNDHRKRYLGQINDPLSMSAQDCVYVDKVR